MSDTLFVIDLETTGVVPATAGIIEIGCVAVQSGAIVGEFSSLVWPGREFLGPKNREVLAVSGITVEEVLDAWPLREVRYELRRWVDGIGAAVPYRVTSYNVAFDAAFLPEPFWTRNRDDAGGGVWSECVMKCAARDLAGKSRLSLANACAILGIEQEDAHRALPDARAAAAVWLALEGRNGGRSAPR